MLVQWLNDHYVPLLDFDTWSKTISVGEKDLQYLFDHGPAEGLYHLIQKQLPLENRRSFPIVAFKYSHLTHFYIFRKDEWVKMGGDVLLGLFQRTISPRMYKAQLLWERNNSFTLDNREKMEEAHKRTLKIAIGPLRLPRVLAALRKLLGAYLELNLKNIVEYEFIF